ncbi:MAG: aspartate kinase [Pseudomonadota bacterium]
MSLLVQKFGGTSVGGVERITAVANNIKKHKDDGHQLVVVVSAMSGETNRLLGLAGDISDNIPMTDQDVLLSTGEQVTIALLSMALKQIGIDADPYCGWQIPITTDSTHAKARILDIKTDQIQTALESNKVVIVAGFQGICQETNRITTLGRGGSDTTAVALAAALKADECQIFTDVDGVYTTDPRVVSNAKRLDKITFEEMLEMASLGSKVLQIRSVEFAGKYQVPLRVLSSFSPGEGTLICVDDDKEQSVEAPLVSGIAFVKDEAKISLLGVPDKPGVAATVLGIISDANIEVDMIVQNISADGESNDFTFTVHRNDMARAVNLLTEGLSDLSIREIKSDDKIAKVSLVGVGMRSHAGIASTMFKTLADLSINIQLITTSEIKISVLVDEKYMELAVRGLHDAFELDQ